MLKHTLLACMTALSISILSAQEEKAAQKEKAAEEKSAKLELPSGESIMDKYIEAAGGIEAHEKLKDTVFRGVIEVGPKVKMGLAIYSAEPNLHLQEIDIPGIGKMLEGVDGNIAWSYSAMSGPSIKEGKDAERAMTNAKFHDYDWRAKYRSAETEGVEMVEEEECYKVILTPSTGNPETHYYSRQTGLLVRDEKIIEMEGEKISIENIFKDYRKLDGVMTPFKMIQSGAGQTATITFTEIKNNVDIPKSTFEPPEDVRALL